MTNQNLPINLSLIQDNKSGNGGKLKKKKTRTVFSRSQVRGHPFITFAKFSGFWISSPLSFAFHATYRYCRSQNLPFLSTPLPSSVRT